MTARSGRDGEARPESLPARHSLGRRSLSGEVFVLQAVIVLVLITAATLALVFQARYDSRQDARNRALAAAEAFAHAPGLPAALASSDPTASLEPLAEGARRGSGLDFVAVMTKDGIRYTDSRPELIGKRAKGDLARAAAGHSFTEVFTGQPSDAVRAVVPVRDAQGKVVGLVATGIEVQNVGQALSGQLPLLLGAAAGALLLGTAGAALVSRRLRRQTRGLGAADMARMNEHHEAVLHAVREGVLIVDADHRLLLANDEARRLLDLPPTPNGGTWPTSASTRAPPSCWSPAGSPPTRCTWRATGSWPSTYGPPSPPADGPRAAS